MKENNDRGWVSIHRKIWDNPVWFAEPFSKGQAWVDLILGANHKKNTFVVRGVAIEVGRGQLAWSEITMAKRWRWSRMKVRRYLHELETIQQIEQQKIHKITTVVTIKNYNQYQNDTTDVRKKDNRRDTNNNDNNVINNNSVYTHTIQGVKLPYGELGNVMLTEVEYTKLCDTLTPGVAKSLIEELDLYISSKGARYKSHYATVLGWARRRVNEHHQRIMSKGKGII